MVFERRRVVRFSECDPAGIVFYGRYFEMLSALMEDWFNQGLGAPFADWHLRQGIGTPTARFEVDFHKPSRLDDELILRLTVLSLGDSSCRLRVEIMCGEERRVTVIQTIVYVGLEPMRSLPWPQEVRAAMMTFAIDPEDSSERPA